MSRRGRLRVKVRPVMPESVVNDKKPQCCYIGCKEDQWFSKVACMEQEVGK
jgi:hypothetical protein